MSYLARRIALSEMRTASHLAKAGFLTEASIHYEIAGGLFEDAGMPSTSDCCYANSEVCRRMLG